MDDKKRVGKVVCRVLVLILYWDVLETKTKVKNAILEQVFYKRFLLLTSEWGSTEFSHDSFRQIV